MSLFDNVYPQDWLFLKVAGIKQAVGLPLCEAVVASSGDIVYDHQSSDDAVAVFKDSKGKKARLNKKELLAKLQKDIYGDKMKVTDCVIQPADTAQTPEVTAFLEKY